MSALSLFQGTISVHSLVYEAVLPCVSVLGVHLETKLTAEEVTLLCTGPTPQVCAMAFSWLTCFDVVF